MLYSMSYSDVIIIFVIFFPDEQSYRKEIETKRTKPKETIARQQAGLWVWVEIKSAPDKAPHTRTHFNTTTTDSPS